MATTVKPKPLLRGSSHQAAFFVAAGAGALLLTLAPTAQTALSLLPYLITLLALFGVSAVYHRVTWSADARLIMKRLDHSTIFLFIAGTYTPICLLAIKGSLGHGLLAAVWCGAALGVGRAVCWPKAPKAIAAALYVFLGWLMVAYMPAVLAAIGLGGVVLLGIGGVLYSLGAVVYALRRPDPFPAIFGYHEIFHALVVGACICHFGVIARLVLLAK